MYSVVPRAIYEVRSRLVKGALNILPKKEGEALKEMEDISFLPNKTIL